MPSGDTVLFETCMHANRSLSARGLRVVAVLLILPSLAIGCLFAWLGAWPVPGFCGAEILVAILLLLCAARAPRAWERIVLRPDELLVSRGGGSGETERVRLVPFWTRIELVDRPAAPLRVRLVGGRGSHEVGALLGEAERRTLARRLSAALRQCRGWQG